MSDQDPSVQSMFRNVAIPARTCSLGPVGEEAGAGGRAGRGAGRDRYAAPRRQHALATVPDAASRTGTIAKARENKKLVGGYFSTDVRRSLHLLALEEGVTIQALLG